MDKKLIIKNNKLSINQKIFVSFFILAGILMIPLLMRRGIWNTNYMDWNYHLSRILGLENIFESPVNFSVYNQRGQMIQIAYPWLMIYPAYLLGRITGSWYWGYQIYQYGVQLITLVFAYFSGYRISSSKRVGWLFSILYTFASYRLSDVYSRGAIGETLAFMWLPLVFLGVYEVFYRNEKHWHWLAIGMIGTVYSHTLSVAMNAIVIGIALVLTIWRWDRIEQRLLALILATGVTVMCSIAYVLPFIEQIRYQPIYYTWTYDVVGLMPTEVFIQCLNNRLFFETIGALMGILLFVVGYYRRYLSSFARQCYLYGFLILLATTNFFPWELFKDTFIHRIQNPSRLYMYVTLFIAYSTSCLFEKYWPRRSRYQWGLIIVSIALMFSGALNLQLRLRQGVGTQIYSVMRTNDQLERMANEFFTWDYMNPTIALNYDALRTKQFLLDDQPVDVEEVEQETLYHLKLTNQSGHTATFDTPVFAFKGQRVMVNDQFVTPHHSTRGTTAVNVPSGQVDVKIWVEYTPLARVAHIVGIGCILIYGIFLVRLWHRQRTRSV